MQVKSINRPYGSFTTERSKAVVLVCFFFFFFFFVFFLFFFLLRLVAIPSMLCPVGIQAFWSPTVRLPTLCFMFYLQVLSVLVLLFVALWFILRGDLF